MSLETSISEELATLEGAPLIERINALRAAIHEYSPFKGEPVDFVRWVPNGDVYANAYNPNAVAPPEMELLRLSIAADGFCVEQSTPVLCADLTWRSAGSLEVGQEIIAFDEEPLALKGDRKGRRNYRKATVTFNELRRSPLVKVTTEKDEILCTPDHPWLVRRGYGPMAGRGTQWVRADALRDDDLVMKLFDVWEYDQSREAGWLSGFLDGEGTMCVNLVREGTPSQYRLAAYQRPGATANRMIHEMTSRAECTVGVHARAVSNPKWSDMTMVRVDRMTEIAKLLGSVKPQRLLEDGGDFWEGRSITAPNAPTRIVCVEPHGEGVIASLSTSEKTYIAGGYAMHNTQPCVTFPDGDGKYEIVDGFHRNRVGKEFAQVRERLNNYLPVVAIRSDRTDKSDRMASTVRHNRARGKHSVDAMSDMVIELKRRNWSDVKIAKNLGMDQDEVLRLCQLSGLSDLFNDSDFSQAWDAEGAGDAQDFEAFTDQFDTGAVKVRTSNTSDEKRIFHPYKVWECYRAGFYATGVPGKTELDCEIAYRDFLSNDEAFRTALAAVTTEWKYSCEHYLTNSAMNRIAWLGQASACYAEGLPSMYRGGFNLLSKEQQATANASAFEYLNKWLVANGREPVTMDVADPDRQSDIY